MALTATFIYYLHVSSGMLNGLGKPQLALLNLGIGSAIKLTGIYFLTPRPELRIIGSIISITLGYIAAAILNFFTIGNTIGYDLDIKQTLVKPLFSSFLIFIITPYLSRILHPLYNLYNIRLVTLLELVILGFVYLITMFAIKAITADDIKRFTGN